MSIPARITAITLGAHDLPELREFYRRLGWELAVEGDDFCVFATRGALLAIYPRAELAADGHTTQAPPNDGVAISIGVNVDEREQVDVALEAVRAAGAHVLKEPEDAFWGGRSAYWADPENNIWEIAWVPPDSSVAQLVRSASGL
jgi:catechol 2,3-dioxygenase-like lactoylglutathione lyase family enzyme